MDSQFDLQAYISVLRRRYLYLIIPAVVVALVGVAIAYVLPPVFRSSATLLIESQQIPTDLATPTVTSEATERVRVIEQRLMTRDNLLAIAGKFKLYQDGSGNVSPTQIVENMRRAAAIEQIKEFGASNRSGVVGFTVSFEYRNANIASQVANELVNSLLSQNIESRLNRASETSSFFEQQKKELEQRLLDLERKIAEFRRENEADLPETLAIRRDQLLQLRLQINEVEQKIRVATSSSSGTALDAQSTNVAQLGYTLQAKELELSSYRDQREELRPLAKKGIVPTNRIRDLDRQISVAEINIEALKAQIASQGGVAGGGDGLIKLLQAQLDELNKQATDINNSILKTPLVQVQLNSMDRDYASLQAEYQQSQAKVEDAQTGERLEQDRQSERFEVIEQAIVPDVPASPDRPKIMAAGAAGGIALGIGFVIFRQMLDKSIYTSRDLERTLQLKPIATIPYVVTSRDKRWKMWKTILVLFALAFVVAAALVAIDLYYLPLDTIMQRVGEKIQSWLVSRGIA